MAKFRQADCREKQGFDVLLIEPCQHRRVAGRSKWFGNDVGIEDDHSKLTILAGVRSRSI
jgi:hypothetical protein